MRHSFKRTRDDLRLQAISSALISFGRIAGRRLAWARTRRLFDALNVFS
jgi:hypothetical protein